MDLIRSVVLATLRRLVCVGYTIAAKLVPEGSAWCFISYPDCSDNPWSFFRYIRANSSIDNELIWLVLDVDYAKKRLSSLGKTHADGRLKIVRKNSIAGIWSFLRARHIFFSHGHYWFVRQTGGTKLFNLWHGMPIKAIGISDNKTVRQIQASDYVIATSEYFRVLMATAFNVPEDRVIVCGQPRCDVLYPYGRKNARLSGIFRDRGKKVVLWMPTYRISIVGDIRNDGVRTINDYVSEFSHQLSLLNFSAMKVDVNVLVKLHPMDVLNDFQLPDFEFLKVYPAKHPVFEDIDLYELLAESSGLLTDISSVSIDYLISGKPMCVVWPSATEYVRTLLFGPDELRRYCNVVDSYNDVDIFFKSVAGIDNCSPPYKNILANENNIFHANIDGNSCFRLAGAIKTLH